MMSQVPRQKVQLGTASFLISDTLGTAISSQTFLREKAKSEIVTSPHMQLYEKSNHGS